MSELGGTVKGAQLGSVRTSVLDHGGLIGHWSFIAVLDNREFRIPSIWIMSEVN